MATIDDEELEELEHQYSPNKWSWSQRSEDGDKVMQFFFANVKVAQENVTKTYQSEDVKYGDSPQEFIRIYGKEKISQGGTILVFVHGGYWQMPLTVDEVLGIVPPFVDAGCCVMLIEYDLAPKLSIAQIVEQTVKATKYISNLCSNYSGSIYLSGHSAGGHLIAMLLAKADDNFIRLVKGAVTLSGLFDLRPIVPSSVNKALALTEDTAWEVSPMKYGQDIIKRCENIKVLVVVAECDPPAFHKQSREFFRVLVKGNAKASYKCVPGVDHFDLVENFAQKDYQLTKEMKTFMGLV